MFEIFNYPFMQRALLAALLTGLLAPAIGIYLVQRRLSLLGDGLGHVAIAGVGLALMTGQAPIPWAVAICVAGAVLVEVLRQRGKATGDVGLAILFYGGLAAGVLMSGIAGAGAGALSQYLFGSLTTVTAADLVVVAALAVLVLVPTIGLAPRLFAVCSDEELARTQGLPVRFYNIVIVVVAAITVTLAMRTVGLLLVSALMVVPVAAAHNLVRSFFTALVAAMAIGVAVSVGGAVGSYYADTAPGALIVILAIAAFALSWPIGAFVSSRRHTLTPVLPLTEDGPALPHVTAAEHDHRHGDDCGHPAVRHGDHTDYLHEGHRHAAHVDHYDEH